LTLDTIPKLGINCPTNCTFHPNKIGWQAAEALAAARARGAGSNVWKRAAEEVVGRSISDGVVSRHLYGKVQHYLKPAEPVDETVEPVKKPSDVEILDSIIGAGFRNSKNWKPTIRDTLEAMKLKTSMTGNSAFDDLIALFDVNDDDEEAPEAVEAVLSEEERPDEGDSELEEPV